MGFIRRLFKRDTASEAEKRVSTPAPKPIEPKTTAPLPPDEVDEQTPLQTRPLAPPKKFDSRRQQIKFASMSDIGQVRTNNQDACLAMMAKADMVGNPPPMGFFVVADGMGGHHDGELASTVTVQTLVQHIVQDVLLPQMEGFEPSADQKTIPEVLIEAMEAANQAVQAQVPNGGTTATCVVLRGDLAFIAHVGDSRAYLLNEGNLELVTRDHSLVRRLQELGQLTEAEAEVHPQRNVLYRAIGQGEALEVDTATRRLPPSSRLLICSDGLWGEIGDEAIMRIVRDTPDPHSTCERLIEAANLSGGHDNITAVLIQMPD